MKFSLFFLLSLAGTVDMFKLSMSTLSETAVVQNKKSAVIVGGGPVGLAGALMLEKCGWTDIKVIEKRAANYFESTKAYLYLVDRRGQRCTDLIGTIQFISLSTSITTTVFMLVYDGEYYCYLHKIIHLK
jgi:2-polyprenyl-6-methoxyphenol hydroxylase-like FAD-dependent oxidoreductase